MAETFPNLGTDLDIQIHKVRRPLNNIIPKQSFLRNIIIKCLKSNTEEIFKGAIEKIILYKGIQQKPCRPGDNEIIYSKC